MSLTREQRKKFPYMIGLYGTLRDGERNASFIDFLVKSKMAMYDDPKQYVLIPDIALTMLEEQLPAVYYCHKSMQFGVKADLLHVSLEGIQQLDRFEGSPKWYRRMGLMGYENGDLDIPIELSVYLGPGPFPRTVPVFHSDMPEGADFTQKNKLVFTERPLRLDPQGVLRFAEDSGDEYVARF